jgi:hypothetical protein
MKSRSQRRHDESRVVKKRLITHPGWGGNACEVFKTTGKPCSCMNCMTPRRNKYNKTKYRLTIQERQLIETIREDV